MRPQLMALVLGCFLNPITADPQDGGSCQKYNLYNCADANIFDEDEMAEFRSMGKRDVTLPVDPRSIDFSELDNETGFNMSSLVLRSDFEGLDAVELHNRIREVLGDPTVLPQGGSDMIKRFELLTRAGSKKSYSLCNNQRKMTYNIPGYPSGSVLYDNADWSDCNNFVLESKVGTTLPQSGRSHIDEHILERNMLQQFSKKVFEKEPDPHPLEPKVEGSNTGVEKRGKKPPRKPTMCDYLGRYWDGKKRNVDDHNVWDLVGNAWPHTDAKGTEEMVRTDELLNGLKTTLFQVDKSVTAKAKTKKHAENIDTVHLIIAKLKLSVLLTKYMDDPKVNAIYYKQAKRVSQAFERAENGLEANYADGQNGPTYKKLGLHQRWMDFMDSYTDEVIEKLSDWMKESLEYIKKHVETGKADPGVANMDNGKKELHRRMEEIIKQVEGLTGVGKPPLFKNPFKPGAAPPEPEASSLPVP